jgi:hypothetical protein
MSGERPKAPLWPEGISKVRPVENQRTKTLREGVAVPVAKEPSLAEQKDRERLSKPPPAESPVPNQAEPQSTPQQRKRGRKRLSPDIELVIKGLHSVGSPKWDEGLSEEQIAISGQMLAERRRLVSEGAPPEEMRKRHDELLLKMYPGLSLEEARRTDLERDQKILRDIQLP